MASNVSSGAKSAWFRWQTDEPRPKWIQLWLGGIKERWVAIAVAIFLTFVVAAGNLIEPQIIRIAIDRAILEKEEGIWIGIAASWLTLFGVQHVALLLRVRILKAAMEAQALSLRKTLLYVYVHVSPSLVDHKDSADLAVEMTNDIDDLQVLWGEIPIYLAFYLLSLIGSLVFAFTISTTITIYLGTLTLTLAILGRLASNRAARDSSDARSATQDLVAEARKAFASARLLQLYSIAASYVKRIDRPANELRRSNLRLAFWDWFAKALGNALEMSAVAGVLIIGGNLVVNETLTLGALLSYIFYLSLLATSFRELANYLVKYNKATVAARRLSNSLSLLEIDTSSQGDRILKKRIASIEIKDASFHYAEKPVLSKCSLGLEPGVPHIIRGNNGSGKTTLMDILSGLRTVSGGGMQIDTIPFSYFKRDSFWRQLAVAPQEGILVEDSVEENLKLGKPDATFAELADSLKSVGLPCNKAFMNKRRDELSTGQMRCVSVARCLLRTASVYILDEPTANLDEATCKKIISLIEKRSKENIVIVTTHDPRFVICGSKNFQMVDGRCEDIEIAQTR